MFAKCRLGAVCYYVNDVNRTEAFYRDVLGLAVQRMDDDGHGNPWLSVETREALGRRAVKALVPDMVPLRGSRLMEWSPQRSPLQIAAYTVLSVTPLG